MAEPVFLEPGSIATLRLHAQAAQPRPVQPLEKTVEAASAAGLRIAIEAVSPAVDGGRFPVKRVAGEIVTVTADLLCDGHDQLAAALHWRRKDVREWRQARFAPIVNDRWQAQFFLADIGTHEFFVEAWRDAYATYRDELGKKHRAGVDVTVELMEGRKLLADAGALLAAILARFDAMTQEDRIALLLSSEIALQMAAVDPRPFATRSAMHSIDADRLESRFASWYEIFPRSTSDDANRHGTFRDVERHLPRIRDMGFNVLYFPPIHPIGTSNRKGRNNTLSPVPEDPGSPYAIGGEAGGHDAIHPELGTLDDFLHMRDAAAAQGLEIALDFAIQCSPDHPWLKQHPGWFDWRPDGSIKYAENPPKKYQDIVNVDFYAPDSVPGLWVGLAEVVLFWCRQGVRIFRVDNPHTKPFPFWEWLIAEVRARFPDALFLAEAFTRPKIMNRLGKIGFSQSYTYFTWRNTRQDRKPTSSARISSSIRRTSTLSSCRPPGGRAISFVRRWPRPSPASGASIPDSSFAKQRHCRGARNISIRKNTRSAPGSGIGRAISWPRSHCSTGYAGKTRRCNPISACASSHRTMNAS
jgi:starch synthase (maltosyl-transferring)